MLKADDLVHKFSGTLVYYRPDQMWVGLSSANAAGISLVRGNIDDPDPQDFFVLKYVKEDYEKLGLDFPYTGYYWLRSKVPVYLTRVPARSHKQGINMKNFYLECPQKDVVPPAFLQEFPGVFDTRLRGLGELQKLLNIPVIPCSIKDAINEMDSSPYVFSWALDKKWMLSSLTPKEDTYYIFHKKMMIGTVDRNKNEITPIEGSVYVQELLDYVRDSGNRDWRVVA